MVKLKTVIQAANNLDSPANTGIPCDHRWRRIGFQVKPEVQFSLSRVTGRSILGETIKRGQELAWDPDSESLSSIWIVGRTCWGSQSREEKGYGEQGLNPSKFLTRQFDRIPSDGDPKTIQQACVWLYVARIIMFPSSATVTEPFASPQEGHGKDITVQCDESSMRSLQGNTILEGTEEEFKVKKCAKFWMTDKRGTINKTRFEEAMELVNRFSRFISDRDELANTFNREILDKGRALGWAYPSPNWPFTDIWERGVECYTTTGQLRRKINEIMNIGTLIGFPTRVRRFPTRRLTTAQPTASAGETHQKLSVDAEGFGVTFSRCQKFSVSFSQILCFSQVL